MFLPGTQMTFNCMGWIFQNMGHVGSRYILDGGFKYLLKFTPTWWNEPIWRMGWFNHQLVVLWEKSYTPEMKVNIEPKNHRFEKKIILQTFMTLGSMLIFLGVTHTDLMF